MKTLTRTESMTRELMRDIDDYFAGLDALHAEEIHAYLAGLDTAS
jgi:hypothetical protein